MVRFTVWGIALAILASAPSGGRAADPKIPPPALELRMKSVVDLAEPLGYFLKLAGQDMVGMQIPQLVKIFASDPKGFEGVDLNQPFGGYVAISENVGDSPIVLMIPIANADSFLDLLKTKAGLDPKKGEGDVYAMDVPNIPFKVYFRFANGYAYATIRSEKGIDKKHLLTPKEFFPEKPKAVLAATLHIERIPADLRTAALGQIELLLKDWSTAETQEKPQKNLREFFVDQVTEAVKTGLAEAKSLSLTFDVDQKKEEFALDVAVAPKSGTDLAKTITSWADRPSAAAAIAQRKSPTVALGVNAQLPKGTSLKLGKLLDELKEIALETAVGEERDLKTEVLDSIYPTLKSADWQWGFALVPEKDKPTLLLGASAKEGNRVEKVAKKLAPFIPDQDATIKFDAAKLNTLAVHSVVLPETQDAAKVLGPKLWLGTSDDLLALSWGPNTDDLKSWVEAKPAVAPMLTLEIGVARMLALTNPEKAKEIAKLNASVFGDKPIGSRDAFRIVGQGGLQLQLRATLKGAALQSMVEWDKLLKQ